MNDSYRKTYRVGIIGYGGYGRFLAQTWKTVPGIEIVALAGRTPEAARHAADELEISTVHTGPAAANRLIADPSIDIVAVASPPADHAVAAVRALEAGKHVFCEKPVATTVEDAERVRLAVRRTGRRLAMGFILRFDPLFERLKRMVDEELFGRLHRIDFENFAGDEHLPPGHWFWDTAQSGGILVEHGVHFFDIYSWLAGAVPRRITGHRTVRPGTTQEDRVMATVEYENGVLGSFYHAFDKPSRLEKTTARLAFDRGYVEIDGWIALRLTFDASLEEGDRVRLDDVLPGWSEISRTPYPPGETPARGGGGIYNLSERVEGTWTLSHDKQAVYGDCARAALLDLVQGINDPGHAIRADVDSGVNSVRIAAAVPAP